MSKKILIVDLEKVLPEFTPAIGGMSDLNEKQAERLGKKLVRLLVQRCKEEDVIGFEAEVSGIHYSIRTAKTLSQRIELTTYPEIKDIKSDDKLHVFILKPKKPEVKHEKDKT